tara:strand:+ start:6033 stop:6365 length:333 start_codon:yes stop_codon:yes gene_type:complete
MIEVKDLRIGNLVNYHYKGNNHITTVNINLLTEIGRLIKTARIEPIPLTEEWLVKFGFDGWDIGSYTITLTNGNFWILGCDKPLARNIKHVHQLQNLYHALTGEELIKTK